MLEVKFKRIAQNAVIPVRNGACYDLAIPNEVVIQAGQTLKVGLGFAAKLPPDYYASINMRSSAWQKYGICLTNQTGIIDAEYAGNNDQWILSLYRPNSFKNPVSIPAGTRIAQFTLERYCPNITFIEVDSLESPDRGGFGSTGD